jgi:hypothetical protein
MGWRTARRVAAAVLAGLLAPTVVGVAGIAGATGAIYPARNASAPPGPADRVKSQVVV